MDLEPPLDENRSSDFDSPSSHSDSEKLPTDDEDPYSFSSTSTSLIGLLIVFAMLGIPLLAIINERSTVKKSIIPISLDQNGLKSSSTISISWFGKFSS